MVSKFEQYLLDKGYTRYYIDCRRPGTIKDTTPNNDFCYSSMDIVTALYIKDDVTFVYGLHEKGHPPCLISPRPTVKVHRKEHNEYVDFYTNELVITEKTVYTEVWDASIDIVFEKETIEDIYNACLDKTIVFEYDLTNV